jgi:hypothetical protein
MRLPHLPLAKAKRQVRNDRYKNGKMKSVGISKCDCHDMLSACLAMTGEGLATEYDIATYC